ncbi:hypothetical protein [Spirosoma aerolatum]|nr:hypothetical protein [Spirosoma aerolatum]
MSNQTRLPISRRRLLLVRHRLSAVPYSTIKQEELETAELS